MFRQPEDRRAGLAAALLLAAAWAVLPAAPALWRGEIVGSPFTDLYPSVWGLAWFAAHQPGLPVHTDWLGAPEGMRFYFSSPLHGWLGTPLWRLGGPAFAYDATLLAARFATVAVAFGCFRAAGLGVAGGLAAAGVYGASPFFQGYAAEGIVEGTDGWTLPLWAWIVLRAPRADGRGVPLARRAAHLVAAAVAFAAVIVSSWYLGMVACLLALGWGPFRREAWASAGLGLLLATPFVALFVDSMSGATPLPDAIRAAMGAPLGVRRPGIAPELNPFAINTWIGVSTFVLAALSARERPLFALGALSCAVLSLGRGPWYDLPVLQSVRFPYRWHAGTLFCLAPLVGATVDRLGRRWLAVLPVIEGFLLSPVEPVLPGAPADVPGIYDLVRGPVLLEVPGPVAMPPGEINRSRPRARYLLHHQLFHGAASPWAPDFNGVADVAQAPWLASFASWDPLVATSPVPPDVAAARAAGVVQVMVHREELRANADPFEVALQEAGAVKEAEDGDRVLYRL
ncbi:MAG: hypothetical protein ACOZNI_22675 [Myxococcota bacterium]